MEDEKNLLVINDRDDNYMHVHFWEWGIVVRYWDKPYTVTKRVTNHFNGYVTVRETCF